MNIILTGASTGIGFAIAELLGAESSHTILCINRKPYSGKNPHQNITSVSFDLKNKDIEAELLPLIRNKFKQVDLLIHNAATLINKPFAAHTDADWQEIFETNVFSVARLTRLLLPMMSRAGHSSRSHILHIASVGGIQGSSKFPGLAAYSASKAAIINMAELLAEELQDEHIAVNCICPGSVQTDMLAKAFPGFHAEITPDAIAEFIVWFGLNGHKTTNGKIIPVSLSTP